MTNPNLSRDFLHACQSGNLSSVKTLVSKHEIRDWTLFRHSTSGDTALHVAAREGHSNIVRYLCEAFEKPDFRVDVTNKDTKRPLHEAAQFARSDIVKYLIEKGFWLLCNNAVSPLQIYYYLTLPSFKGATVDALKRADWTPLMLACTKTGSEADECITALLEAKANPFFRNKDGWTSLHMVCRSGNENAFDLLANRFPECLDARSNNGRSAIHIAGNYFSIFCTDRTANKSNADTDHRESRVFLRFSVPRPRRSNRSSRGAKFKLRERARLLGIHSSSRSG